MSQLSPPPPTTPPCHASPFSCLYLHQVEGSHGNDGLLLGRPLEEPDQPVADKSLLEIIDGIVMMYNLSVHQQLGKVSLNHAVTMTTTGENQEGPLGYSQQVMVVRLG